MEPVSEQNNNKDGEEAQRPPSPPIASQKMKESDTSRPSTPPDADAEEANELRNSRKRGRDISQEPSTPQAITSDADVSSETRDKDKDRRKITKKYRKSQQLDTTQEEEDVALAESSGDSTTHSPSSSLPRGMRTPPKRRRSSPKERGQQGTRRRSPRLNKNKVVPAQGSANDADVAIPDQDEPDAIEAVSSSPPMDSKVRAISRGVRNLHWQGSQEQSQSTTEGGDIDVDVRVESQQAQTPPRSDGGDNESMDHEATVATPEQVEAQVEKPAEEESVQQALTPPKSDGGESDPMDQEPAPAAPKDTEPQAEEKLAEQGITIPVPPGPNPPIAEEVPAGEDEHAGQADPAEVPAEAQPEAKEEGTRKAQETYKEDEAHEPQEAHKEEEVHNAQEAHKEKEVHKVQDAHKEEDARKEEGTHKEEETRKEEETNKEEETHAQEEVEKQQESTSAALPSPPQTASTASSVSATRASPPPPSSPRKRSQESLVAEDSRVTGTKRKLGDRAVSDTHVPEQEDVERRAKRRTPSPPTEQKKELEVEKKDEEKEEKKETATEAEKPVAPKLTGFAAYANVNPFAGAGNGPRLFGSKTSPPSFITTKSDATTSTTTTTTSTSLASTTESASIPAALSAPVSQAPKRSGFEAFANISPFGLATKRPKSPGPLGQDKTTTSTTLGFTSESTSVPTAAASALATQAPKRSGFEAFANISPFGLAAKRPKSPGPSAQDKTQRPAFGTSTPIGFGRNKSPLRSKSPVRSSTITSNAFSAYTNKSPFANVFASASTTSIGSSVLDEGASVNVSGDEGGGRAAEAAVSFGDRLRAQKDLKDYEDDEEAVSNGFEAQHKVDLTQQELHTGEEEEDTIYQCRGKLYFLEGVSSWRERGTGTIKLNVRQSDGEAARLIMRKEAVYTVLLNAPLFKGMKAFLAQDPRFVRFSVFEDGALTHYNLRVSNAKHAQDLLEEINSHIPC